MSNILRFDYEMIVDFQQTYNMKQIQQFACRTRASIARFNQIGFVLSGALINRIQEIKMQELRISDDTSKSGIMTIECYRRGR